MADPSIKTPESTKPWGEKRLNGWRDFIEAVEPLSRNEGSTLFRGQTRDDGKWSLKPSLVRAAEVFGLSAADVIKVERVMLLQFQQVAHLYFPASVLLMTNSPTDWLMLMQQQLAAGVVRKLPSNQFAESFRSWARIFTVSMRYFRTFFGTIRPQ